MPDGSLTIVAKPNPLSNERMTAQAPSGQTIAQLLGENAAYSCEVTVGGYPVPRAIWGKVRPKAGQTVHAVVYPQGGGNGSKLIRTVAIAVISYYTFGAGGAGAANGSGWLGAGASSASYYAIGAIGLMALGALIPPPSPKMPGDSNGDPFQQLNSLTGTSNQANPYGVIPCVVGTKRFFPPHAALPYSELQGEDQYLRMLLDLGFGDLEVSDIQIGGADISAYEYAEWQIGTNPTLFNQDIYEEQANAPLTNDGDVATRTTQPGTTEISLDIVFPRGLYGVDATNNTVTGRVEVGIKYREVGASDWIGIDNASGVTYSAGADIIDAGYDAIWIRSARRKTLRFGIRWTVPAGQYEVQVRRGSSSWTAAGTNGSGGVAVDGGTVGEATWSVLRSITPQLPSTTGTNKLALRIKATDQLNGVIQSVSVLASQKVRQWDPATQTFSAPAVTTNPAHIYPWLMTQCQAVARRVSDDRMDWDRIGEWAAECEAKGFAIGFVMDSARAFGDIIRDVLAAGRASFGLHNGKYSAVRDIEQTVPVQMFTPANSWGFSYSRSFIEPPHALRVKFTNPEANDQQDVRLVYWDGYSEDGAGGTQVATRFEELDLSMVIDPDAAWCLGRYHLSVLWLRPTQYTFQADLEHMVCERGDLVHVAHDLTGWGLAWGRVKAVSGSKVALDEIVGFEPGKSYAIRVRRSDLSQGESDVSSVVTWDSTYITFDSSMTLDNAAGPSRAATLADPIDVQPGDLYVVGEVNRVTAKLIIRAIEPGDDFTATLTCVDAAQGVWTADSGTPPAFVSDITGKFWCDAPPEPVVYIRAGDSAPDDAGVIHAQTGVSASNPSGGIVRPGKQHYRLNLTDASGGAGCVVVESFLPDGRQAGEVAVGDTMQLADATTLEPCEGTVSYSEPKLQPCVEITTVSGVVLRCSTTAPIPTMGGLVLAPTLAGKSVAVKDDDGVRWEPVASMRSIGQRMVQHITVENACFWAGNQPGRFVLHHNTKQSF